MKNKIKEFLIARMVNSFAECKNFIMMEISNVSKNKKGLKILDVGCGNGENTQRIVSKINLVDHAIFGIDISDSCDKEFINYTKSDFENEKFPYEDNFFDVVFSNQVIEHILNKDNFISEINRVLKKGGVFFIATENISSFDNIISIIFGQEPLSQHTGSKYATNSIFSPHFMQKIEDNKYQHKNVCSYFGLQRLAKVNGFKKTQIKSFGNAFKIFEILCPIYNRLICIYGTKE